MLRKILLVAFMATMLFAFSCKKEEPKPAETSTIKQQTDQTSEEAAKQAGETKQEAGKALENAGKELQK
jgi:hypothetical protein